MTMQAVGSVSPKGKRNEQLLPEIPDRRLLGGFTPFARLQPWRASIRDFCVLVQEIL
jgi:hypothetical protein